MVRRKTQDRHGLYALKAKMKLRGLQAIDMRTAAAQEFKRFRESLIRDLGGNQSMSEQQMTIVNLAARAWLFINHIDAYLAAQDSLVDPQTGRLLPVLRERQALAGHLARLVDRLGLQTSRPRTRDEVLHELLHETVD